MTIRRPNAPSEEAQEAFRKKNLDDARAKLKNSQLPGASDADIGEAASVAVGNQAFEELAQACLDPEWTAAARRGSSSKPMTLVASIARRPQAPLSLLRAFAQGASQEDLTQGALWAARAGCAAHAIELVGMGADIDGRQDNKRAMLHYCVADSTPGHIALLAFLLAEGANADAREGQFGAAPLAWACYSKNPAATKLLAGHGNLDAVDLRGQTALHMCSAHDGSFECAQILLDRGATLHIARAPGFPCPFEEAILNGSPAALAMAAKVDYSKRASDGSTWLEFAGRERGYIEPAQRDALVKALLEGDRAIAERQELHVDLRDPGHSHQPRKSTL